MLRSVLTSNSKQIEEAYRLIKHTGKRKIAMLGLSFKPGTDDLRESPIAALVELLLGKGHEVAIYDREVLLARLHGSNRTYIEQTIPHIGRLMKPSVETAVEDAELIVIAKRSTEYRDSLARVRNGHPVIDSPACLRPRKEDPTMKESAGRVLMLVENNYPADTRVRNEATTLAANGYAVSVIALRSKTSRSRSRAGSDGLSCPSADAVRQAAR